MTSARADRSHRSQTQMMPRSSLSLQATGRWGTPWRSARASARAALYSGSTVITGAVMAPSTRAGGPAGRRRGPSAAAPTTKLSTNASTPPPPPSTTPPPPPPTSACTATFIPPRRPLASHRGRLAQQRLLQLLPRPHQARPHRRPRDQQLLRNLVVRALLNQPQLVHLAKRALQVVDRRRHLLLRHQGPGRRRGRLGAGDLVILDGRHTGLARAPPAAVDEQVVHDRQQPDAKVAVRLQPR